MDLKLLADTLTAFLAPALPYLVSGGKGLIQEAGKKLGEDAPELLKTLWAKLRPKVEEKPAAVEAVQDAAKAPEDSRIQTGLSIQLQKILEADSTLAAEIAKLLEGASPTTTYQAEVHGSGASAQGKSVAAGAGGIAAGRDVRKGSWPAPLGYASEADPPQQPNGCTPRLLERSQWLVERLQRLIVCTQWLLVSSQRLIERSQRLIACSQSHIVSSQSRIVRSQSQIARSHSQIVSTQSRIVRSQSRTARSQCRKESTQCRKVWPHCRKESPQCANFVALCLAGAALGLSGIGLDLLRTPLPGRPGRVLCFPREHEEERAANRVSGAVLRQPAPLRRPLRALQWPPRLLFAYG